MKQKRDPIRKCAGCGLRKPKSELIRVVKKADKEIENSNSSAEEKICLDFEGKIQGRGAYICKNPACLKLAFKARRFEKAFSCKVPESIYEQLKGEIDKNER